MKVLLLSCLSVLLHELGHAFAMRKNGIQIREICLLGLGGPRLLSFRIRKLFGETPITIRAFIFGGFVAPTYFGSLRIYCIDYYKAGNIYGGGIAANFLLGAFLFFIHSLLEGRFDTGMVWFITGLLALGIAPKLTFRLYPLIGLYLLVLFFRDLSAHTQGTTGFLLNSIKHTARTSNSFSDTLYLGGLISVALGIINCIPILPSDGGKIIERILCSISYRHRHLIIGLYKSLIVPLLILLFLAMR